MIAIISPAKNMRQASIEELELTTPEYIDEAQEIVDIIKEYSPWELESFFRVNPKIALEAFHNYQAWEKDKKGFAALLSYHGLQYKNIGVDDFTLEDFYFANKSLRILTGLYGILKPTDGILPYRLEMQTKLPVGEKHLYGFWEDKLYKSLYRESVPVINLASKEYSKAIEPYLNALDKLIDIDFKVNRNGKLRTIATLAKIARGQMVRYIIRNRLTKPQELKDFSWDGYQFMPGLSYENKYVFVKR